MKFRTLHFFDEPAVIKATTKAERRVMSRIGAFIRTTARRSFGRKTKKPKPSKPGDPPRSRTGFLKRGIFFAYDPRARAVEIGPIRGGKPGEATTALEHGSADIEARPYMGPALVKELPKLPGMWRNAIRP